MDNSALEQSYLDYFSGNKTIVEITSDKTPQVTDYTYENYKEGNSISSTADVPEDNTSRLLSEDNIDDVDELAEKINLLLNAAWGDNWGQFSSDTPEGEDPSNIQLPQITYDAHERTLPEAKPIKPQLFDTVKEVADGKYTGDAFMVYRQWFDCTLEFNVWGRNNLEVRRLMKRFESILSTYSGYLKKYGLSEIIFMKEMTGSQSDKYIPGLPMRAILYMARIERITVVRQSTIKRMELAIQAKEPVNYFVGKTPAINNNNL